MRAVQKQNELELPNLRLIRMDADSITDVFASGEVDRIYLNFSDPWPKERHAKRRLTSVEFLRRYENILAKDGHVEFKTDNQPLFEFSLEAAEESWMEASGSDPRSTSRHSAEQGKYHDRIRGALLRAGKSHLQNDSLSGIDFTIRHIIKETGRQQVLL